VTTRPISMKFRAKLQPCQSRRDLRPDQDQYFCAHPRVFSRGNVVTSHFCRGCILRTKPPKQFRPFMPPPAMVHKGLCFYLGEQRGLRKCESCRGEVKLKVFGCRHPLHEETTVNDCKHCGDYEPRLAPGGISSWAVGVVAGADQGQTLPRCLAGLAAAGWDSPHVFLDREVELPSEFAHLPTTRCSIQLAAWPGWFLGLSELIVQQPTADAYLLLPGDVALCRNLRAFLQHDLWPAEAVGAVALDAAASREGETDTPQIIQVDVPLQDATTYILPSAAARSLLSVAAAANHRRWGNYQNLLSIDQLLRSWSQHTELPLFAYTRALARHVRPDEPDAVDLEDDGETMFVGREFEALPSTGARETPPR